MARRRSIKKKQKRKQCYMEYYPQFNLVLTGFDGSWIKYPVPTFAFPAEGFVVGAVIAPQSGYTPELPSWIPLLWDYWHLDCFTVAAAHAPPLTDWWSRSNQSSHHQLLLSSPLHHHIYSTAMLPGVEMK